MRRCGLTLVEMLVTISVIVVLAALLIPSLQRSKLQAKAVTCTSNIRQLSIALFSYATDDDSFPYAFYSCKGMLPPEDGYAGNRQYDRKGWWWFNYLEELYKKSMDRRTVLQCPSKNLQYSKLGDDILCGNYGVNLSICKMTPGKTSQKEFVGSPLTIVGVPHPSQTLLLLDSGYAIISWWHAADKPPVTLGNSTIEDTAYVPGLKINKNRRFWRGGDQNYDALYGRHPRKTVNIGYMDGHIMRTEADDLLVEKISDDKYKNKVPLWRPE
jgi:prepilin-type N-terminal cleavage/methylation domain-containing protein/prepilin-type processing-associated H-X9-DG protein